MPAQLKQKQNVILSGGRSPESKDLRTDFHANVTGRAKILRLALLAQDDRIQAGASSVPPANHPTGSAGAVPPPYWFSNSFPKILNFLIVTNCG